MSTSCTVNKAVCFANNQKQTHTAFLFMRWDMNGYMKIAEASKKWGIGERRVNTLCLEGRIEGAFKFGNTWAIPADAEKPKDERIKSGKYCRRKL